MLVSAGRENLQLEDRKAAFGLGLMASVLSDGDIKIQTTCKIVIFHFALHKLINSQCIVGASLSKPHTDCI